MTRVRFGRLRLATLLVDTAGASLMAAAELVDLDAAEAEALYDRLLEYFYRARAQRRAGDGTSTATLGN